MDNTKIFICTHKDFKPIVSGDSYEIIDARKIRDKVNLPLDDKFWSEFYQFKYVVDNVDLPEYVGFCHYRRYFSFLDDIPKMEKDKVVITTPLNFIGSVEKHYAVCHNLEDLKLAKYIILTKFQEYGETFDEVVNNNKFIPYNMFIMHRDIFKKYCEFIFGVMNEYLKLVGLDIEKRIRENSFKYLKQSYPNNTVEYQYRIGGYVGERLSNVFIRKHFKNIEEYDMIQTEKKY